MSTITQSQALEELRTKYIEQLPERMEKIRLEFDYLNLDNWNPDKAEHLLRLIHSLCGSAGTFGLGSVTEISRKIEKSLSSLLQTAVPPSDNEWLIIAAEINQLEKTVSSYLSGVITFTTHVDLSLPRQQSPLVFIVEDDQEQANFLSTTLLEEGYKVKIFYSTTDLFKHCTSPTLEEKPSALIMDMMFPEGNNAGAEVIKKLKTGQHRCPPIVFVSVRDDIQSRLDAFRAGASRYLTKPVDGKQLINTLDVLTGHQPTLPYRVLMVDDEPLLLHNHAHHLRSVGINVLTLTDPLKLFDEIDEFKPDVIVLDVYMPLVTGPELAAVLRERESIAHIPILFLSAETNINQQLQALYLGGDDFLTKPVEPEHFVMSVLARARRSRHDSMLKHNMDMLMYEREREHAALNHHAIVSITDAKGNIIHVNDKFCEISGYSRSELIGKNHRIVKSNYHPQEFYSEMWRTILQGHTWHGELCNQKKDGGYYWVASSITPFMDKKGNPYQFISIRTDITKIKDNESSLRALVEGTAYVTGNRLFETAITSLSATLRAEIGFISEVLPDNPDCVKTMVYLENGQFQDNFTYELKNTPCEDVIHGEVVAYAEKVCESFSDDRWLIDKKIESYIAIPLYDTNHTVIGHMGVMSKRVMPDVANKIDLMSVFSARVSGELQRKHAEQSLRENEARLNFLVSSSPVVIYTCDAHPPYAATYVSPNVKNIMGLNPLDFISNQNYWAERIHPEDKQHVFDGLPQIYNNGHYSHEYRFQTSNGDYRWMHDELLLIRDNSGEPTEIIGYWADVTQRKQFEIELEANKERLRRGQIFANVGTWDWNIQTGDLHWSERIAPLFGYPQSELETSYNNFLAAVHPDDRQLVIDAVNATVQNDAPYDIEHRVIWPDGTERWLMERGAVLRDNNGKPLQMLGVVQDIDDRKRAEIALAERERQLREAQSLAKIGNWSANLQTGELTWSDEIYKIFGFSRENIKPSVQAFMNAVHPDDKARVLESEQRATLTGLHDVIHRITRPDGSIRHVHELANAVKNKEGVLIQLVGTVQDITERVEAEARLRETEERFAFAVEGAGDGVWDWNMLTNEMKFSRLYMEMLGYKENELPNNAETWVNSVHPDDISRVNKNLEQYFKGEISHYSIELRLKCKNGSFKWILCRGTVVNRDINGNAIRMIGIHSDISERKNAEEALKESQAKLSGLFELSPLGIAMTDMHGRYLEFNKAFQDICGYTEKELKNIDYWVLTPNEYAESESKQLESLKSTGRYGPYEKKYIQKNGDIVPIRLNGILVKDKSGEQRIWSIVENITDSKKSEQELIEARDEAYRANKAKSEFLSSMSHELRTPMNAIMGFGQLLQYDKSLSEEHKENVDEILKAGKHLLNLINEVLDLAKVESGHIDLSLEPVEICSVIHDCISLIKPLSEKRNITIRHSGLDGALVRADRTRFKQVILNLLSNAIKYNKENGNVDITVKPTNDQRLRIYISDTGYGISTDRLNELFQPFHRLDAEHSDIEGSGIGLTLTRRLIEMMGGSIQVESQINQGSTFWIELPVEYLPELTEKDNQPGDSGQLNIKTGKSYTDVHNHLVLYIEDNPANLRLVTQILGRHEHIHLITAHTSELGIELAMARHPELILLDINLPGMDGYQVLEVLKTNGSLKNTPVVAITANAMPKDIERGIAAGFADYITKPIDIKNFHLMINRLLKIAG